MEAADKSFVDLGRDFERARAKLGQLRTSFDGRSVIDDVVCLQHVAKLLSTELEAAISGHRETAAQLSDWRTRHATKVREERRVGIERIRRMIIYSFIYFYLDYLHHFEYSEFGQTCLEFFSFLLFTIVPSNVKRL